MPIDVWMQHPTQRFLRHEMFASLRRWTGQEVPDDEIPIAATVGALDHAGVSSGLLSAWHGPREGALISNDQVAGWVAEHPDRLRRTGRRRPLPPDERRAGTAALRHRTRIQGPARRPVVVGGAADRPALLPALRGLRRAGRSVLHAGRPHGPSTAIGDRAPDPLHRPSRARFPRARDRRRSHRLSMD